MKVEQVKLLKTLKFGKTVWIEGSYFPNREYPSIPAELLLEVARGTGTVEVTQQSEEKIVPPKTDNPEKTSTTNDVVTSVSNRASLEEALQKEKAAVEAADLPKKRKSKLVRRK
jgi:hypothetical protein